MKLYLHNLSVADLTYLDIGLVVPANGYFELDTTSLNDFMRYDSSLKADIVGATYGIDLVLSTNVDPLVTTDFVSASRAVYILTNGFADEVFYNNDISGLTAENVQAAIDEVKNLITATASGLTWRNPAFAITTDAQLAVGGTIAISALTLPFNDDVLPANFTDVDLTPGKYLLYKDATPANDRVYLVVGTDLVEQTGVDGKSEGYCYVVQHDLLDDPDSKESYGIYLWTTSSGFTKAGDIDWNHVTLQNAYSGGATIELALGTPLVISNGVNAVFEVERTATGLSGALVGSGDGTIDISTTGTGGIVIDSALELTFQDQHLTNPIALSETTEATLSTNFAFDSQTAFNWSRTNQTPDSIIGSINANRNDLFEFVELLNTQGAAIGTAAGANLIGVDGIAGIIPTGGTDGSNSTLQAMLEGLADGIEASGGKTYTDITAFTTAKAAGTESFVVGEPVFIQNINRFIKVLTITVNIVQGTDWEYVGAGTELIGGDEIAFNTEIVFLNTNVPTSTINGATYYDTDLASLMVYDLARTKYVSVAKHLLQFGAASADGQYLTINGVQSGLSGFLIPHNAVITRIMIKGTTELTKGFEIRRNGTATSLLSFSLTDGEYTSTTANIDLAVGDFLQVFAIADGGPVNSVVATIEVAYRK